MVARSRAALLSRGALSSDLSGDFPDDFPDTDHRTPAPMKVRRATANKVVCDVAQPRVRRGFNLTRSVLRNKLSVKFSSDVFENDGPPQRRACVARKPVATASNLSSKLVASQTNYLNSLGLACQAESPGDASRPPGMHTSACRWMPRLGEKAVLARVKF